MRTTLTHPRPRSRRAHRADFRIAADTRPSLPTRAYAAAERILNRDLDEAESPWRLTLHDDLARAGLL